MKFKNPCKICLVQPICKEKCGNRESYMYMLSRIGDWAGHLMMFVIAIQLGLFWFGHTYHNYTAATIYLTVLYSLIFIKFYSRRKYQKEVEYDHDRFNLGVFFVRESDRTAMTINRRKPAK